MKFLIASAIFLTIAVSARAENAIVIATHDVTPIRGFPHTTVDWISSRFWPVMFDALTEVGEGGVIEPALASAWTAEDERTWTFQLRPGVSFSNGEPMDGAAVADTFAYLLSSAAETLQIRRHVANIASVTATDADTVVIRTKQPDLMLPGRLRTVRILPPRHFKATGPEVFALNPHGTGPFVAETLKPGRSTFVRNLMSWRPPKLDRIAFVQVGDALARAQAVVSGSADIALGSGPSVATFVERAGARLVTSDTGSVDVMPFVTVMPGPMQDRRVRIALNHAVNKQALIEAFMGGATMPATQFAPPGTSGFTEGLTEPFPYDPAKARALLAEAGYPNGFATMMEIWINSADQAAIYQQIATDFAAVGVRARIVNVPILEWQNDGLYAGKWKAPLFNFSYNALPSFDAIDSLPTHSCLWAVPYHCDRAFSDRIVTVLGLFDPAARLAATKSLFADLNRDPPAILLFPSIRFDVVGRRVKPFAAPFGIFRYDELDVVDEDDNPVSR